MLLLRPHFAPVIERERDPPQNGIMAKRLGKRKIDSECRVFNPQWTHDYFFVQCKEKAVCLICQETVAVFKEYNLRRHYESRHKDKYDSLQGQMRADKLSKLKSGLLFDLGKGY